MMQFFQGIVLIITIVYIRDSRAQQGTCGGDCVLSEDCALESGNLDCRCSYFHCRVIPEGSCGGGCIFDSQCSKWSGDSSCICGPLFECMNKSALEEPGFDTFVRFMKSARGGGYQTKINKMLQRLQSTSQE